MLHNTIEQNKILEIRVGSNLYGTNRPTSDEDFSGIFIPPINYFFGLDKIEEIDMSVVSKKEDGRNDENAVDRKFFEVRKFVKLALDNNPNIIEQLFVDEKNVIFANEAGRNLLNRKHLFLHKGLKDRFVGYAISQKKKMYVKRDNMNDIEEGILILSKLNKKSFIAEHIIDIISGNFDQVFKDTGTQHIQCGDIHIQKNIMVDRALEQLENRKSKFSGRKEMVDEYGYDTKFAMHLIRLLLEGKELLATGHLIFPLVDRPLLMDIREGKYSIQEIDEMAKDIESDVVGAFDESKLPENPRYNHVNNLLVDIVTNHFNRNS